jgi:hypothetical protein
MSLKIVELRLVALLFITLLILAGMPNRVSAQERSQTNGMSWNGPGTNADRLALFDYLLESTMQRESFSDVKNERLRLNVRAAMLMLRPEFIAADTDEKFFYALEKLSNVRRDRHLSVTPVERGVWLPSWGENAGEYGSPVTRQLPIKFAVDFGVENRYFVFVSDLAGDSTGVEIGDKLIAYNGMPFERVAKEMESWVRWSTPNGYWWKLAEVISTDHYSIPRSFLREGALLQFEKPDGTFYTTLLDYEEAAGLEWAGHGLPAYPGFELISDVQTFDLYRNSDESVLLLDWYGFREDLPADIDSLVSYATNEGILDYNLVLDMTRSRGGSKGAYAIQHLTSKPFRTTFGNLKLSDVTLQFVDRKREEFRTESLDDSGVSETIDNGQWLMDWLEGHVIPGLKAGQAYSSDVPFKSAHAPMYSDGILHPAEHHFSGDMAVLLGPHGGSHLDQFASIVADNKLGLIIGMPAGGYSNTWEWEEVLVFPTTGRRIASYMWSIGHTIRPNGDVLEGNPADVDRYVPQTRENYFEYRDLLLESALEKLGSR